MTRTTAREIAVQLCYAQEANPDCDPDVFFDREYFSTLAGENPLFRSYPDDIQLNYIRSLVMGVREHGEEIDRAIEKYSQGWKLRRISRVALAVLRCAIYELLYVPDVPNAAAINEAVELAKGYVETETVSFINGVLGSFSRAECGEAPEKGESPEVSES